MAALNSPKQIIKSNDYNGCIHKQAVGKAAARYNEPMTRGGFLQWLGRSPRHNDNWCLDLGCRVVFVFGEHQQLSSRLCRAAISLQPRATKTGSN